MDRYGPPSAMRPPVPPMRVSSLSSSRTMSSNGGRSSEASSLRSGRSGMSFESGHRTSQESTKPRLSKDQQEYLERRFAEQQKPNTQTKKTFANELNVPLEKINNWFQNRRAKSKQDAKKKHPQYVQFAPPHHLANGHPHPLDQSYIDQSFYHTNHPHHGFLHGWPQPVLPGNSAEPMMNPNNTQFDFELDPSNCIPNHGLPDHQVMNPSSMMINDDPTPKAFETFFGFSDPSHPAESHAMNIYRGQFFQPENFGPTMDTIPEYDIPDSAVSASHLHSVNGNDTLSRQNTISSEELSNSIPYPPGNGDLPIPPSTDFFHPIETQGELYSLPTWGQSAGRPLDMGDTTMQEISMAHGDSQLPYRTVGPAYPSASPSTLYHSNTSGATFSDRVQNRDVNDSGATENGSRPSGQPQEDSSRPATGMGQRRDSTMSRLVESIDSVHVQPHALEKKPSQQSIGHPSLATRRQRRPAPLGASSTRSTSFSSTTPASPKAVQHHSSERELRRIKSSIGAMNGRVQKSGLTGAAQRSPLSFTFSDAAASARASKSLSSRSMTSLTVDTLSRSNSLVPATPASAEDDLSHLHFGSLDSTNKLFNQLPVNKDDSVWANMPNTSDTTTESVWSSLQQHPDAWINFNSPPDTPLQQHVSADTTSQDHLSQSSMAAAASQAESSWTPSFQSGVFDAGYHEAVPSALNQAFSQAEGPPDLDDLSAHTMQDVRRDSQTMLENNIHQSPTRSQTARSRSRSEAASVTPQPAHQTLQSPHRGDQPRQAGLNMFHVSDPDLRNLEPGQVPLNLMQATTTPPRAAQQLVIQHFSPRDPVPTERMPPRTRPVETPKNFEFQTCGPESFSSP